MSLNLEGFLADVKRAALEAVLAAKPFSFTYGTVINAIPLQISVDQKLTLQAEQLILTNAVRDYNVEMTVDHITEQGLSNIDLMHAHSYSGATEAATDDQHTHNYSGSTEEATDDRHTHKYSGSTTVAGGTNLGHNHAYTGKKHFTVHLALKKGEQVILLRADGGQKYIVLDRVEVPA